MAQFRFKARDARGELIESRVEADTADAAASQLMNAGVTPIEITEEQPRREIQINLGRLLRSERPTLEDLILFSRQMYALVKAGVPMIRALRSLSESARNPWLIDTLEDVIDNLESGRDLAGSLARHPQVFTPLYINVVRVGEASGRLEEAFLRLYHYLSFEKSTRERVKVAFRYPVFVVVAVAIAIGIIVTVVIPPFARIFERMDADLPLATQIVIAISDFTVNYWYLVLGAIAALVLGVRWYVRTERGRYRWDRLKFRLPILGDIMLRSALARFARALTMSFRSGVPLNQAMTLVGRAADNEYLRERVAEMRNGIEHGDSISRTAAATGLFTPLVLQMMAVGEETGAFDDMMEEVAEFYEREVAYDVENLGAVLEPILIGFVAVLVLILALSVFLPMWNMYGAMTG